MVLDGYRTGKRSGNRTRLGNISLGDDPIRSEIMLRLAVLNIALEPNETPRPNPLSIRTRKMQNSLPLLSLAFALLFSGDLVAQEQPAMPKPTQEHQWLQQFSGVWTTKSESSMGPGQPPIQSEGKMTSRMLGGFWLINNMKGDYAGTPMNGIQTIGFDESKQRYVGTWIDSVTSMMWRYEGQVDSTGKILTLEAEGPNFMSDGTTTKFEDIYEFKSKDELAIRSRILADDGTWVTFVSGIATRSKAE
jgi:hypothetical protein